MDNTDLCLVNGRKMATACKLPVMGKTPAHYKQLAFFVLALIHSTVHLD